MKRMILLLIAGIWCLSVGSAIAEIIDVPGDERTIQAGINAAQDGDTVLVAEGEYNERINFGGRAIVVCGDPENPDRTIINGNANGTVVTFDHQEDANSVLTGFTITNGQNENGGGVFVSSASPVLENLYIVQNAGSMGAGVCVFGQSSPLISNVIFLNNRVQINGGAIAIWRANAIVRDVVIIGDPENQASMGGGIYVSNGSADVERVLISECNGSMGAAFSIWNSQLTLNRALIVGNQAENGGAFYLNGGQATLTNLTVAYNSAAPTNASSIFSSSCDITMINSIFTEDGDDQTPLIILHHGDVRIGYSDIIGGQGDIDNDQAQLTYERSNINADPCFVSVEEFDFSLSPDSPCINAGDPNSPPDPDGSRADIGFFPYFNSSAVLWGHVFDASDNSPISEASILTNSGEAVQTDQDGYWIINNAGIGEVSLLVAKNGFNTAFSDTFQIEANDSLEVNFNLTHPMLSIDVDHFESVLTEGGNAAFQFSISNSGDGPLEWSVTTQMEGLEDLEPLDSRVQFNTGAALEDDRLMGVAYANGRFYVSGANGNDTNTVYVLDRDGGLVNQFAQPGDARYGSTDMEWDGERIWLTGGDSIYAVSLEGEVVAGWAPRVNPTQTICWDPEGSLLWTSGITTNYEAYDAAGNFIRSANRQGWRSYGFAYWPEDPDGMPLYVAHSPAQGTMILSKMNPISGDTAFVRCFEGGGTPHGIALVKDWDPYSINLAGVTNFPAEQGGDRIDVWLLEGNTSWMVVEPTEGEVSAGDNQPVSLTLDATDLMANTHYRGSLVLSHNAIGGEYSILIDLLVADESELPGPFGLLFPADGDTVESMQVTFGWEPSTDPNLEDQIRYLLWISSLTDSVESAVNDTTITLSLDTLGLTYESEVGVEWWVWAISGNDTTPCRDHYRIFLRDQSSGERPDLPSRFCFDPPYPNPFNSTTALRYSLPTDGWMSLRVFNSEGRQVAEIESGWKRKGVQTAKWSADGLCSGIYMVRLQSAAGIRITKAVLVR